MGVVVDATKTLMELKRYAQRMGKPDGGLKRVGQYVKGLSQQAFRDGSDPATGDAWKKLSPATLAMRRGTTAQILVDTGRLRKSIVAIITGRKTVAVGTSAKYGAYHQFGTKHMPARPFLGFDKRGEKEIELIMKRWILGVK